MPVRLVQTNRCLQTASLADEESRAPGSSIVSAAAPVWPASAPAGATRGWLRPPSTPRAINRNAVNAPGWPNRCDHFSASPTRSLSPAADGPDAPGRAHKPLCETPAKNCRPRPPLAPVRETARSSCARLGPDSGPARLLAIAPLNLPPSCNKISGEDLLLRGSFRASFRVLCFEHECTLWEARLLSSHLRRAFRRRTLWLLLLFQLHRRRDRPLHAKRPSHASNAIHDLRPIHQHLFL